MLAWHSFREDVFIGGDLVIDKSLQYKFYRARVYRPSSPWDGIVGCMYSASASDATQHSSTKELNWVTAIYQPAGERAICLKAALGLRCVIQRPLARFAKDEGHMLTLLAFDIWIISLLFL